MKKTKDLNTENVPDDYMYDNKTLVYILVGAIISNFIFNSLPQLQTIHSSLTLWYVQAAVGAIMGLIIARHH